MFKLVKQKLQELKEKSKSSFSHTELDEFSHIGKNFLAGLGVGTALLIIHVFSKWLDIHDDSLGFFEHLKVSLDNSFIFNGLLSVGVLLFLSGWAWEGILYRGIIQPWLGLISHSLALAAGAVASLGISAAIETGEVLKQFEATLVTAAYFLLGTMICVIANLAANPRTSSTTDGITANIFMSGRKRAIFGLIWIVLFEIIKKQSH